MTDGLVTASKLVASESSKPVFRLGVVIINYRTPGMAVDCLKSLEGEIEPGKDAVIVVDNASGDGSVDHIQQAIAENGWESWITLLPSPVNGGFSAGNNLGVKALNADAYLLLNSDAIVRPGALQSLLRAMADHPEAGIVSPRLEWPDGTPQISCFRYHSPVSELIKAAATAPVTKILKNFDVPLPVTDYPIEPDWTSFACVLIRRTLIEQIGLLDEGYFMYFDDVDYCRAARNAGWTVLHWPDAHVVHLRGGSGPVKAAIATRKRPRAYLYASRTRYFSKFYGGFFGLLLANSLWLLGRGISLLRELIGNKEPHTCDHQAQDIWMNWRNTMKLPEIPGRNA